MNNNIPDILKLNQPSAKPADVTPATPQVQIQEENYFIEQQNNSPATVSPEDNEQYFDVINQVQQVQETFEIDYEQMIIEQYEKEIESVKNTLKEHEKQDEHDGFVNELFKGIKEFVGLGVTKKDIIKAIETQEVALEALKKAQITGNFAEVYEEITNTKYDEEKLLACHQAEEQLEVIQNGLDEILSGSDSDETKQEKIDEFLISFQNENNVSYEELVSQYQELSNTQLGSLNELTNTLNSYVNSQEGLIDKAANFAQIGGMGLMLAGGIACFIPGGAIVGAGMLKAGQVMAMAGTFGDNALEVIDLATNDKKFNEEKEDYEALGKETLTEGAMFAAGYASGFVAGKAGGYVLDKTGKAFLSKATDTALDATLSLASDVALTGEVDLTGEGVSQAIALLTGHAFARANFKPDSPIDIGSLNKNIATFDNNGDFEITPQAIQGAIKAGEIKTFPNGKISQNSLESFVDTYDRVHYQKLAYIAENYPDLDSVSFKKLLSSFKKPQDMETHADDIARWMEQDEQLRSFTSDIEKSGIDDVQETRSRIAKALGLPVEQVGARAKGTESIYDKLVRKVLKGDKISTLEEAKPKVDDLVGTRVTLDDVSQSEMDKIVQNLCDSIERGEVVVTELHNYSKDSQKYFSEENVQAIRQASAKAGNEIRILNEEQTSASGYVSAQMNIRYRDVETGALGARGELQIRGRYMNKYAEIEHIPYDIGRGKNIGKNHPVLEKHFEPVMSAVNKLKRSGLSGKYDDYILQCYQYINDFEHGKIAGKFEFPEFPKELKGFEILSFDSLEVIDKKAKAIKKKYNIT